MTNRLLLRDELLAFLENPHITPLQEALKRIPLRKAVSPLIGFFCHPKELVRLRAITALGMLLDFLAQNEMEEARVVMRRLMWTLNDESGGIGWGAPEAMGEACARNSALASEYHRILCSYVSEEGNFLEHETLQRGALWGLCRLAGADAPKVYAAASDVRKHLMSPDPVKQGLALIFATRIKDKKALELVEPFLKDSSPMAFFTGWSLTHTSLKELARELKMTFPLK
ncbi:MAG: hypothetical protein MI742_02530 [Desulfobacterales bacterium]|nr:hypothetical protein [Desulfobacterales bacterium]